MRCILLLFGIIALAGCDSDLLRVPPPSIGAQLTGDEIKTALSGHSFTALEEQVPPLVIFFAEDGEMIGLRSNNYRDHGTWEIKDDTLSTYKSTAAIRLFKEKHYREVVSGEKKMI